MRTLVIPDIHNKVVLAQRILDNNPADQRVFLGDIYDDFGDSPNIVREVARWHKEQLCDLRNVFLFGNHDMQYAFKGNAFLRCTGYSEAKGLAIKNVMALGDWALHRLYIMVDGWLLSHAGLHGSLFQDRTSSAFEFLPRQCDIAIGAAKAYSHHPLINAGWRRGGRNSVGGLTWLDWDYEFQPIPGLRQLVGHTPHDTPQEKDGNWCIDTYLKHAAIIEKGKLDIFEVGA